MSENLYSLTSRAAALIAEIASNGGELDDASEQMLKNLEHDLIKKASSVVFIKERLEHESEYWRQKAKTYSKIAQSCEKAADRLKESIKAAMLASDLTEIQDGDRLIKLTKSNPKLVIDDINDIPDLYKHQIVSIEPDNEMIKNALKSGAAIPGARLENSPQLRVYNAKS